MQIAVVGSGYVGAFLARRNRESLHASRTPREGRRWVHFDADDAATWGALAAYSPSGIVVGFPVDHSSIWSALLRFLCSLTHRIVVIGSTSAFVPDNGIVGDDAPLDPANRRAAAEEELRQAGACILHAAGIYGAGRNPLDWLRRGRITNAAKLVNLVHGDDLARACLFLLERDPFPACERLIISDGRPTSWREIVDFAVAHRLLADPCLPAASDPENKRVEPRRLFAMGFVLRHPNLFAEIERLETGDQG